MDTFIVTVDGLPVTLFYNKRRSSFEPHNASKFVEMLLKTVPAFVIAVVDLARNRHPENETRHAVALVSAIEKMAFLSHVTCEHRRRIISNFAFFFESDDAKAAIHGYVQHMGEAVLSDCSRMAELQVAARMCDVFEYS